MNSTEIIDRLLAGEHVELHYLWSDAQKSYFGGEDRVPIWEVPLYPWRSADRPYIFTAWLERFETVVGTVT